MRKLARNLAVPVALFSVICLALFVPAQQGESQQKRKTIWSTSRVPVLKEKVAQLMRDGEVPGLSMVILRDSKIYWHGEFGVMNAETGTPVTDLTVFETASLTKPLLAYGVLKLVDQGKIGLDVPLEKYLPNYIPGDSRASLITARLVLSHKTGLQNEVHPGETLKTHFLPGERFSYSGEGYIYLQKVVERITGQRFDEYMRRAVFEPLGMSSASYVWRPDYEKTMANGHNEAGIVAERIKPSEIKVSWLHMTAIDYAKFVAAIINGVGLKKETTRMMLTTQSRINERCFTCLSQDSGTISQSLSWGLGWGIEQTGYGEALWHWGENRAEFQTFVMAYPKKRTGIVVFTNSGNGLSIMPDIVSEVLGGEHPAFSWMPYDHYDSAKKVEFRARTRPMRNLYKEILDGGMEAITRYKKSRKPVSLGGMDEHQINILGYWLMGKGRISDAIEIFRMNTEDYPSSANTYDSLAEAYMSGGNKEMAIRFYQKVLELDPGNANAAAMLERLKSK